MAVILTHPRFRTGPDFRSKPKPVCRVSESLAAFRLAQLRNEKIPEALEKLERILADELAKTPKGIL